ncbi:MULTISPECIES: hypothetical protein [Cupriavidus]|uniref:Uncharacterized protein n=1 Tax=Cupriavidus pauculus TaxID=82633 RepID=A0A5P2H597_9BURK|nr:hypothetical protein [Cupriavidus pauculus]QET03221.1 hypothetical protein FOB72_14975 [Cupriavidus pauculus]
MGIGEQIQMPLDLGMPQERSFDACQEDANVFDIERRSAVVLQFPSSRVHQADQMEEAMLLERILRRSAGFGAWF